MKSVRGAQRSLSSFLTPLVRTSFFLPALLFLLFLVIIPVVQTVVLSFLSSPGGGFVGLANYQDVLSSPRTIDLRDTRIPFGTLIHNLLWIAIHLPLSLFTGLFLAIILQNVRGSSIVKSIIFLGMVTPLIVGGVFLRFLFDEKSGVVPAMFGLLGVDSLAVQWIAFPNTLLFGLILGSVWLWTGFSLIVYSAGLTTIPKDYFEAAKIDGASSWQTFRRVTWPLLRPITLVVVTMTVLWELKIFDIIITAANRDGGVGGAADVLALQMFRFFFNGLFDPRNYSFAAVVATLLTVFTLVLAVFTFRRMVPGPTPGRRKRPRAGPVRRALARSIHAAKAPIRRLQAIDVRWPKLLGPRSAFLSPRAARRVRKVFVHTVAWGIGILWLIPFVGVLMAAVRPFDEILYGWWNVGSFNPTMANFEAAWNDPTFPLSQGFRNSFLVAIPSTLVPMFVATLAAYGFARFRFRRRLTWTTMSYLFLFIVLLMAIPQQMVAVPIRLKMEELGLFDNHLALILVHSAWGIPWILLFMRNFFLTLPTEVEEAARVDGASDFKIFYRIVLPMALPALAAVAVLQFMWVWNDFFFALILISPSSDQQLATQLVPKLGISQFLIDWGLLSAASVLVLLVPVVLYALLQRFYIRGMIGWTIKG